MLCVFATLVVKSQNYFVNTSFLYTVWTLNGNGLHFYYVSMSLSGKAISLFIYFTYVQAEHK